jgi:hypothetical protein
MPGCQAYSGTCGYTGKNIETIRDVTLLATGTGIIVSIIGYKESAFFAHNIACKMIYSIYKRASEHKPTCKQAKTIAEIDMAMEALRKVRHTRASQARLAALFLHSAAHISAWQTGYI